MLIELALGGIYATAWVVSGWSSKLAETLSQLTSSPWALTALFALFFSGIYLIIDLPMSFYSGYTLPHRFGLSNQTLKSWISDLFKGLALSGVFGLLVVEVIYAILRAYPENWWLMAAGFLLLFNVLLANLAPTLLMPIFNKFKPLSEEYGDLSERLMRLAERAGTKVKGVYQFDMSRRTKAANAALTGLGNTRRIILGDTLLKEFTPDEIETVLAHELAHHVHKDIPLGMSVETILTLGGLCLANLGMRWGAGYFGFEGVWDVAAMPLLILALGVYSLATMPLGNAFSRWRERRADQYALKATGKGAAYASALTRLANQNLAEVDPEAWIELLLYSHPALGKRIAMANQYIGEQAA